MRSALTQRSRPSHESERALGILYPGGASSSWLPGDPLGEIPPNTLICLASPLVAGFNGFDGPGYAGCEPGAEYPVEIVGVAGSPRATGCVVLDPVPIRVDAASISTVKARF